MCDDSPRACLVRAATLARSPRPSLYSVPFYGAMMVAQYFMLRAVGAEVGFLAVMLGAPLVSLVALTPITINGLFLAEGAFVLVYASAACRPRWRWLRPSSAGWSTSPIPGLGSGMWLAWQVGVRGSGSSAGRRRRCPRRRARG